MFSIKRQIYSRHLLSAAGRLDMKSPSGAISTSDAASPCATLLMIDSECSGGAELQCILGKTPPAPIDLLVRLIDCFFGAMQGNLGKSPTAAQVLRE